MNNAGRVLLGFAVGAAAGAIAGILMAPEKGDTTRQKLADNSKKIKDDLNSSLQQGIDKVNSLTDSAFSLINTYKERIQGQITDETEIPVQNQNG